MSKYQLAGMGLICLWYAKNFLYGGYAFGHALSFGLGCVTALYKSSYYYYVGHLICKWVMVADWLGQAFMVADWLYGAYMGTLYVSGSW